MESVNLIKGCEARSDICKESYEELRNSEITMRQGVSALNRTTDKIKVRIQSLCTFEREFKERDERCSKATSCKFAVKDLCALLPRF